MPGWTIHKSYIWFNAFIVGNVDVDYFSRGACSRVLSVYLQQAVSELQEEVTEGCSVLVGQVETYVLLLPHVILMPRLNGEIELFHVLILSANVKTHSSFTQQPFPCLHTVTHSKQAVCNNLSLNSVRAPLAEPQPIKK